MTDNKTYDTFLLDFDGTISNTYNGVTRCLKEACVKFGGNPDDFDFKKFIGPPLTWTFNIMFPDDLKKQEEALAYYRALYIKDGLFDCEMYEGIDTLVKSLKKAGARVGVATSKKENFAVMVLEKLGLYQHLDFVSGFAENRTDKTQVICHAIETYGIDKDKCLMIGDTFYDLQGAQNAGIDAVGILYGFGSKEDMLKFPHVAILETVKDLSDFVLQKVDKCPSRN